MLFSPLKIHYLQNCKLQYKSQFKLNKTVNKYSFLSLLKLLRRTLRSHIRYNSTSEALQYKTYKCQSISTFASHKDYCAFCCAGALLAEGNTLTKQSAVKKAQKWIPKWCTRTEKLIVLAAFYQLLSVTRATTTTQKYTAVSLFLYLSSSSRYCLLYLQLQSHQLHEICCSVHPLSSYFVTVVKLYVNAPP